ncbi:MAG TPA: IS3 family transposase, partial [Prosthecobacter sp.]
SRGRAGRSRRAAPPAQGERPAAAGERHFKKSRGHPRHATPAQVRAMIQQLQSQTQASIRQICHVLELPRSSFYHAAVATPTQLEDRRLSALIAEIFKRNRRRYGYRRIDQELKDHDIVCAPARLRRIMRLSGLRAIQPKNYLPKTSDGRADRPSPNLLAQQPMPAKPNEAWAGDITFIPTSSRWLYLAVVIDLGSRRIIGWSLDTHMRSELVVSALQQALQARPQARSQQTLFHKRPGQPVWQQRLQGRAGPSWHAPEHVGTCQPL